PSESAGVRVLPPRALPDSCRAVQVRSVPYAVAVPVRLVLSVAAGLCLWLAFPGHDIWWLAYVGIGALALATVGVGPWRGFLLGGAAGLAYFVPLLSWSGIFV